MQIQDSHPQGPDFLKPAAVSSSASAAEIKTEDSSSKVEAVALSALNVAPYLKSLERLLALSEEKTIDQFFKIYAGSTMSPLSPPNFMQLKEECDHTVLKNKILTQERYVLLNLNSRNNRTTL